MPFSRFRILVFLFTGCAQLIVAVLLIVLGQGLPRESQITATFDQARNTGKRAQYTASLFQSTLAELRRIPLAGRLVEPDWVAGMAQARQDLDAAVGDLAVYEHQVQFSVSTTASIIRLVAAIVALHGIYLILASLYGKAYSP